ncbi:MAG TPA: serine O-acetyltransferase [Clostridiales bacterium]|nr:serine O-acetyltransferase [Clostridiales bacterium]
MFERMKEDIAAVKARDPAATSTIQIMLLYPGYRAIRAYRKAHWLHKHNMPFLARFISQRCSHKTGIEIHPGATIGKRFFIDHGHGVVIGETAEIGDDVTLYQGVTLGGTGKDEGKRHPTVGNNCLIGSGAKILGPIKIGDNSRIAAGAVVLNDIPSDSTAVGIPARVVKIAGQKISDIDQINIPDPVAQEIARLEKMINELKKQSEKNTDENI